MSTIFISSVYDTVIYSFSYTIIQKQQETESNTHIRKKKKKKPRTIIRDTATQTEDVPNREGIIMISVSSTSHCQNKQTKKVH